MSIIEVKEIHKEFKVRKRYKSAVKTFFERQYDICTAVENLNFSIEKGQAIGFIGPNGAGKSTTIKMMTGILEPTAGTVRVMGNDPCKNRKENARHIGVVFGQRSQLWWDLPVYDSFELLAKIYGVSHAEYAKKIELFNQVLGIHEFWKQPVRQLSLGQKMRAEFSASLLHSPEILFLDEPTIGLDIVVKKEIRTLIKEMQRENNTTIILTTHDMKDVDEICEELILIDHGRLMRKDTLASVKASLGSKQSMRLVFDSPVASLVIPQCGTRQMADNMWEINFDHNTFVPNALLAQVASQYTVVDMSIKEPDIEEIMRTLYESSDVALK